MKTSFSFLLLLCIALPLAAQPMTKGLYKKYLHLHRQDYKKDFLKEERSPFYNNPAGLDKIKFYKPDLDFRCNCEFSLTPDAEPFLMATYSGQTRNYVQYGQLNCKIDDQKIELAVYRNLMLARVPKYQKHLFIPFKDLTNGNTTYGGGRYIDIETTDIEGNQVVIDFNKCYNPWCAFSDGFNCPIPPSENHLNIEIKAGEKIYKK